MEPWQIRQWWSLPQRLAGVCCLWKEVVEAKSELWSRIDVDFGDARFPVAVEQPPSALHSRLACPDALTRASYLRRSGSLRPDQRSSMARIIDIRPRMSLIVRNNLPPHNRQSPDVQDHLVSDRVDTIWYNNCVIRTLMKEALQQTVRTLGSHIFPLRGHSFSHYILYSKWYPISGSARHPPQQESSVVSKRLHVFGRFVLIKSVHCQNRTAVYTPEAGESRPRGMSTTP
ncbi:hypothetical protein FRB94_006424 [Tulasnella sp. JGI-2019a]|nr:hypothetical protein FRB94_006424 [Tulasnella sp. JGI-2019a]